MSNLPLIYRSNLNKTILVVLSLMMLSIADAQEFFIAPSQSADLYSQSPVGSASNTGTISSPWDMLSVFTNQKSIPAGSIVWIRGGRYNNGFPGFKTSLTGAPGNPIIVRNYNGERAVIDGAFGIQGADTWYWGLEVATFFQHPDPSLTRQDQYDLIYGAGSGTHVKTFPNSEFNIASIQRGKIINCISHDTYNSNPFSQSVTDTELYGNIIINTGRRGSDNDAGVGLYSQNANDGYRMVIDNVFANNFLTGADAFSQTNKPLNNFTFDGNIFFGNGHGTFQHNEQALIHSNGATAENSKINNNLFFNSDTQLDGAPYVSKANLKVNDAHLAEIQNNLFAYGGIDLTGLVDPIIKNNFIYNSSALINLHDAITGTNIQFNNNTYQSSLALCFSHFTSNTNQNFSNWKNLTSFDSQSSFTNISKPTNGKKIVIKANKYEPGRAFVVIYNWDMSDSVDVDVSQVDQFDANGNKIGTGPLFKNGDQYEIRAVQNLFTRVINGTSVKYDLVTGDVSTYQGQPLHFRMTGWPVSQPTTVIRPLASTFPEFGAFLVTKRQSAAPISSTFNINPISDQTTNINVAIKNLSISISGTSQSTLTFSAVSSNKLLIPDSGIQLAGTGTSRQLSITPGNNQAGTTAVTVTVSDGSRTVTKTFNIKILPLNTSPIISDILDQTSLMNIPTAAIPFSINDAETPADQLSLSVNSSNLALLPIQNITIAGSGANKTISLTPAQNQVGQATITLTLSDGNTTVSRTFKFFVNQPSVSINGAPSLSDLPTLIVYKNNLTAVISFAISDPDTDLGSIALSAQSSDPNLVQSGNVFIGGTGANRTLLIMPNIDQVGSTTITLTASDGVNTTTKNFTLQVLNPPPSNMAPDITILSPSEGDTFVIPTAINLEASGIDQDGAIALVEFFVNNQKIGEATTSPYSIQWQPSAEGPYTFSVRATDNNNTTKFSTAVNIVVKTVSEIVEEGKESPVKVIQNSIKPGANEVQFQITALNSSDITASVLTKEGEKVTGLEPVSLSPGIFSIHWDGKNETGKTVSSGIYIIKFNIAGKSIVKKAIVVK